MGVSVFGGGGRVESIIQRSMEKACNDCIEKKRTHFIGRQWLLKQIADKSDWLECLKWHCWQDSWIFAQQIQEACCQFLKHSQLRWEKILQSLQAPIYLITFYGLHIKIMFQFLYFLWVFIFILLCIILIINGNR